MTAHRVGIMGGTFDPVHLGHLSAASAAAEFLDLESVLFSPAAQPWHKRADHLAPADDRLGMLEAALVDFPDFAVTTVDLDRGGDTYTIDTLADLEAQFAAAHPGESVQWFFITGADALSGLASWKSPDLLMQRATFVGVTRPGHELHAPSVDDLGRVILLEIDETDISSTDIRERVARGDSIAGLVPEAVADYIDDHELYREPRA
jgi:nicotinate-nucleotide adenylyltransferase